MQSVHQDSMHALHAYYVIIPFSLVSTFGFLLLFRLADATIESRISLFCFRVEPCAIFLKAK